MALENRIAAFGARWAQAVPAAIPDRW